MIFRLSYQINDGEEIGLTRINVNPEEKWEANNYVKLPQETGTQKISFILRNYRNKQIIHTLHLWTVTIPKP
jgi:hypothetical protein